MSASTTVINPIVESTVINPIEVDSHSIDIVPPLIQRVLSQTSSTPPSPQPILKRSLSNPVTSKEKELTSGDKTMITSITTNMTSLSTNILGKEVVETFFCGVCMENCPSTDSHSVSCNIDRYCRTCLAGWI